MKVSWLGSLPPRLVSWWLWAALLRRHLRLIAVESSVSSLWGYARARARVFATHSK